MAIYPNKFDTQGGIVETYAEAKRVLRGAPRERLLTEAQRLVEEWTGKIDWAPFLAGAEFPYEPAGYLAAVVTFRRADNARRIILDDVVFTTEGELCQAQIRFD